VLRQDQNQATATDNRNQDLVTTGSGSLSYGNPAGAALSGSASNSTIALTQGQTYTEAFIIGFNGQNSLYISNTLYQGSSTNGPVIATSQFGGIATNAQFLTAGFDSFAIGWRCTGNVPSLIDISSIKVDAIASTPTLPIITQEPISASAPAGTAVPFTIGVQGINVIYQWKRNGTNINSSNLSVVNTGNTSTLYVNPVGAADYSTYSCTVIGAGNLITNSATVSLTSRSAANLVWSGAVSAWDLSNSVSWVGGQVWNYGDNVTFDDSNVGLLKVNLSNYLSAGTVTVTATNNNYVFQNSASGGAISGPAKLIISGPAQLNVNNPNTFTGGTLLTNANLLFLGNTTLSALGTGPVTNVSPGATIEVANSDSGIATFGGDLVINENLTLQPDTDSGYSVVVNGNLRGIAGKAVTFSPAQTTNNARFRVLGTNTTYAGNIVLNGLNTGAGNSALYGGSILAFYNTAGLQTYSGVISGVGGVMPSDSGSTTILSGSNTFTGGTTTRTGALGFGMDSALGSGYGPIGTGPIFCAPDQGSGSSAGTTLFASGGARTIENPIQWPVSTNNQTLQFGGTNALTFTGAITLNFNDVPTVGTNRTLNVTNTALTTFSGVVSDGSPSAGCGLNKQGNGILVLTQTETYTGPTAISNGTLRVNGSLHASSSVNVASNGIVGGTGTINGNVSIAQGGTLSPGASVGILTVGGNLTNDGNLFIEVNTGGSPTSDKTVVNGSTLINNGTGTLTVTNLGPALVANQSFQVFNKAMVNGDNLTIFSRAAVFLNKLAVDGTIQVVTPISTQPTNITASVSGGNLHLSWPLDHTTWTLMSNSVSLQATNWAPVPNSGTTNSISIAIVPNKPNVFYRLQAP
jgi:autotransporter-associated beta strand protein